ncbi:probable magnesium transporter NIPA7 [Musa acuminata AAA Group]|uniref:probable magnesium transporter NIPA7 n=1 Tax=Musa acuminata AAA Group TaxID=214697 RepID=UPI0031DE9A03
MDQDSTNGGPPPAAGSLHLFADNLNGFLLAVAFIGAGFIVKKQGLRRAGASGSRAGVGGYGYLLKPLWRIGMVTMIFGEIANFMAYIFAPAVLVTPLGALCLIVWWDVRNLKACIGHRFKSLHCSGPIEDWYVDHPLLDDTITCPCIRQYGVSIVNDHISSVMSIKAIGIAIKLILEGINHAALDTFSTAVVSPVYYAMFRILTIFTGAIMFKDWSGQSASDIASEICGLITVISGTTLLHSTSEADPPTSDLYAQLSPKMFWHIQGNGEMGKLEDNDMSSGEFVAVLRQSEDYVTLVYRLTRRMMDPEFSPNHAMQVYVGLNFMIDG